MGNQPGKPDTRSVDGIAARSPARTKLQDVAASTENEAKQQAVEGTSTAVEAPSELTAEAEQPIDKYQVVETPKEVTLEVSTMASEVESSTPLPLKDEPDANEKGPFLDIGEVIEKDGAKSPLVLESDKNADSEDKSAEAATHDEKPSDVSATERELLLARGPVSGELSESAMDTSPNKMKRLSQSSSFFKSCLFCIPNPTN